MANTLITKEYLDSVIANLVSFVRTEDEIRYKKVSYNTAKATSEVTVNSVNSYTQFGEAHVYVDMTVSATISGSAQVLRRLPIPKDTIPVNLQGLRRTATVDVYTEDVKAVICTDGFLKVVASTGGLPAGDYILNITYQIEEE